MPEGYSVTPPDREPAGIRLLAWVREWDRDWQEAYPSHVSSPAGENLFQARPRTILDYMRTLWRYKWRTYSRFDAALDFDTWLETWLANFAEDDRRLAFTLASRIFFLSAAELRYLQIHVYRRVREVVGEATPREFLFIDLDGGIDLPAFFDMNYLQGYKDAPDGARLYLHPDQLLDPVKDLERVDSAARDLRAAAGFPEESRQYILTRLASYCDEVQRKIAANRQQFSARRFLILLVDFIGSGGTAERDLRRILRHYNFERVFLVPLVATDDALDRLQPLTTDYPSLQIVTGLQITRQHKVLAALCTLFTPAERSAIRDLCEKYSPRLSGHPDISRHGQSIKYGFGDCQLLFVRQRNTPNNSLPLLWAQCSTWVALFPRTSSYITHTLKGAV